MPLNIFTANFYPWKQLGFCEYFFKSSPSLLRPHCTQDAEVEHDVEEYVPNSFHTLDEDPSCFIIPFLFKHCPKGPGRPTKKCEGAPIIQKAAKRTLDNEDKKVDQPQQKIS